MQQNLFHFNFLSECSLTLKTHTGWLDSALIPPPFENCTLGFPTLLNTQLNERSQGLVMKLLRFNSGGCTNGGFLQFEENEKRIAMCGKLEEFPENRRTLYFQSYANTTLRVHRNPKFYIAFKFVDYCYNVSLLQRNDSYFVQAADSTLKCHFKIHLPYGNRIALKLQISSSENEKNFVAKQINLTRYKAGLISNDRTNITLDLDDLNLDELLLYPDASPDSFACDGISIEIINRLSEKWNECVRHSDAIQSVAYTLTTSDNVLFIRVTKNLSSNSTKLSQTNKINNASEEPIISLTYAAEPIDAIVSRCAFGWILMGQFCLTTTFNQLLAWQNAENQCNAMGGHLASIRSDTDQELINKLLVNR